ncbi:hypothetical protein ACIGW3_18115 [Streptomyces sp. NPDC053499]|uniref:hypothetical protein n=1 Tax=Streptomyces sp. NPDC053499 TaxID=3365707 RepID=UPI0037D7E084
MPNDVNAPTRAPFLQTPESLIDNVGITPTALRLLQALAKLPPRNARNSDAVAKSLRMGKDRTNAARKILREQGHWHARKRQNPRGEIRDQRLASLAPLRTRTEIETGWAAAEEAARLGKDTAESRRLGVRIVNSAEWLPRSEPRTRAPEPAAGSPAPRPTRRRPQGDKTSNEHHTPHPSPKSREAEATAAREEDLGLGALTGPLASYAQRAERLLLQLRRTAPALVLTHSEARELAQVAGHYLLRGEEAETLRTVLTHGLPAGGVRCPREFARHRLLRYLPPVPDCPTPTAVVRSAPGRVHPAAGDRSDRPGGPAHRIRQGHGWRAVLADAARQMK